MCACWQPLVRSTQPWGQGVGRRGRRSGASTSAFSTGMGLEGQHTQSLTVWEMDRVPAAGLMPGVGCCTRLKHKQARTIGAYRLVPTDPEPDARVAQLAQSAIAGNFTLIDQNGFHMPQTGAGNGVCRLDKHGFKKPRIRLAGTGVAQSLGG